MLLINVSINIVQSDCNVIQDWQHVGNVMRFVAYLPVFFQVEDGKFEDKLASGLVTGHAYSVTNIIEVAYI